jgi:hypothetical protein
MGSVTSLAEVRPTATHAQQRRLQAAPRKARGLIDTDYWLAHCEGYRVDSAEGRIGFVEEVRLGASHPEDTILAVRMGMLGRRVALIPASAAEIVVPRAERIWLRTRSPMLGSEPLRAR